METGLILLDQISVYIMKERNKIASSLEIISVICSFIFAETKIYAFIVLAFLLCIVSTLIRKNILIRNKQDK